MEKIWENSREMQKMLKRYLEKKCIACGKEPCKCKTKGKLRNRKSLFRNEMREPSKGALHILANQEKVNQ